MDMKKKWTEFRVGIFVILGIAILVLFIFKIGDFKVGPGGYSVKIIFGFVNGVKTSAPVRVAGVDVGEIASLRIFFDPQEDKNKVEILVRLKKEARIPIDSAVWINTLGLLGEKYVEIMPGEDYTNFLKEGDTIIGEDPISMQAVGALAKGIAEKMDATLADIKEITGDEEFKSSIKDALAQLNQSTIALNNILTQVNSGEGTIGKFLYDDSVYKNLNELSSDLKANPWKLLYRSKEKK